jgi:hypothetical protein
MDTAAIRKQLHDYLEFADEKKIKAIYTMVEDEINASQAEYTQELKDELDRRVEYYLNGGVMVTPAEMNKRLKSVREKRK